MSNINDLTNLEIIFDNGGGTTLQTATYAHHYDDAAFAASDYSVLVNGGDIQDWEGNDPDARVTDYNGYRDYDHADIQAIVKAGCHDSSWRNESVFFRALGVRIDGDDE